MWKETDTVLYYISPNFNYEQSVASFGFSDVLIKNPYIDKKKKKVSIELWAPVVLEKLHTLYTSGASIVIFDYHYSDPAEIKKYFVEFLKLLKLPVVAFFASKKNKYNKPNTNVWRLLNLLYRKENKSINHKTSLHIGHNAGRVTRNKYAFDTSCADRAFASNIGVAFSTPDRFFLNFAYTNAWRWDSDIIPIRKREALYEESKKYSIPILEDILSEMPDSKIYTVIIAGPPSSGKTELAHKIKRKWDTDFNKGLINIIGEDIRASDLVEETMEKKFIEGVSVIIDAKHKAYLLTQIVKVSMKYKAPVLILKIRINHALNILFDCIKVQMAKSTDIIPTTKYQWKDYKSNYHIPVFDLPCVKEIDFPIIVKNYPEFWYEYSAVP
jgi:DNA 3'-phosphatase